MVINSEYSYFAYRVDSAGISRDTSNIITAHTLPATSHDFNWTEYTIGEWQSVLYDVWGTSENNVYAVGGVQTDSGFYSIWHWDGFVWKPDTSNVGGNAIFGFSENDIWVAGGGVGKFNGTHWAWIDHYSENGQGKPLDKVLFDNTPYTAIWGTSSENLYFGSEKGSIIYWDGDKGTKIFTSDYPIQDIWGTDENHFHIAAGIISGDLPGELYSYKNGTFELIKEGISPPFGNNLLGPFLTVWYFDTSLLYLGGGRIYSWNMKEWQSFITSFGVEKIRGNNTNDITAVGHAGGILHYNGLDWFQYQQAADRINSVWMMGNKVFAVGRVNSNAYITIGTRN